MYKETTVDRRRQEDDPSFFSEWRILPAGTGSTAKFPRGLKDLPPDDGGKNPIHCILSLLRGQRKADVVPPRMAGGALALDQTALPYDRGRDPAGGSIDAVCRHIAGRVRPRNAASTHRASREYAPSS